MSNPKKNNIDIGTFNMIIIVLTSFFLGYLVFAGIVPIEGITSNAGGILLNLGIFLGINYGIEFFQRGFGTNIRDEIYEQNNVAAALYQGFFKIAVALVIAKGLL